MKKTTQLKQLLQSQQLECIMEAHNGLSARIVEEAGFSGIWGSGLSISAALGVRDSNEASWTQILEVLEFMSDGTSIPILLDGDTGYGNFNNARRLIRKLEQRGIAGVCLEDKLFPKTNSLLDGKIQPLADIQEFALKITACKETQQDPDFCVIARVEAFIAGWPLEENLRRAHAYADAGADGILIHSKKNTDEEIQLFMQHWNRDVPIVIVPTKYYQVPTENFAKAGVSLVIWANHLVRSSVSAMQQTTKIIKEDNSLMRVEPYIASVSEIFRLQGEAELNEAEKKYLPQNTKKNKAIILAASRGSDLKELTTDKPKCMLEVRGKTILGAMIDNFHYAGIQNISIVRGYKKEVINFQGIKYFDNERYDQTGELYSLAQALPEIESEVVISYGDIILQKNLFAGLLATNQDIVILVDASAPHQQTEQPDLVQNNQPYNISSLNEDITLKNIAEDLKNEDVHGEMIGVVKLTVQGSLIVKQALEQISQNPGWEQLSLPDLLKWIIKKMQQKVYVQYILGGWLDIDNFKDLSDAYK